MSRASAVGADVAEQGATLPRFRTSSSTDGRNLKAGEGHGGTVTLIQRFGSVANLNIHLHFLVLDGVYRFTPVTSVRTRPTRCGDS